MNKPHVTLDNTIQVYYTWGQIRSIHYFNVCIIGMPTYQAIINVHVYTCIHTMGMCMYAYILFIMNYLLGSTHGYHNTFDEHTCMTL